MDILTDVLWSLNWNDIGMIQVVLLTDGMDTRPFRLPWPLATTAFDVSPSDTYNFAAERLEGRRTYEVKDFAILNQSLHHAFVN